MRTSKRTFSSNLSLSLVLRSTGENNVQPPICFSPSDNTRNEHVSIAAARIFVIRMSSRGSVEDNLRRNSENTDNVRFPKKKSMTACENQSLKVDV